MIALVVLLSLAAIVLAPFAAAKLMGLKGGVGKSALVALVSLGSNAIISMIASNLGPLGGILGIMGWIAAWFQIVRVVYGTDTARTMVFMFWHIFFQLLFISLLQVVLGPEGVSWAHPMTMLVF